MLRSVSGVEDDFRIKANLLLTDERYGVPLPARRGFLVVGTLAVLVGDAGSGLISNQQGTLGRLGRRG